MKKSSLFKALNTYLNPNRLQGVKTKKVRFVEEGLDFAKKQGTFGFSIDYFMFKIDKFFAKESSVVLIPTDDEYDKYLAAERKK
jgi:hypothetical protein